MRTIAVLSEDGTIGLSVTAMAGMFFFTLFVLEADKTTCVGRMKWMFEAEADDCFISWGVGDMACS